MSSNLLRQFAGMIAGVAVGWLLLELAPGLESLGRENVLVLAAILGVVATSLRQIERAGAALTRRDDRRLNFLVGLGVPVLIVILLAWTLR